MGLCVAPPDITGKLPAVCTTYPDNLFYRAIFWRFHYITADHVLSVLALLSVFVVSFAVYKHEKRLGKRLVAAVLTMGAVLYVHEGVWFLIAAVFYPVFSNQGLNNVLMPLALVWVLHMLGKRKNKSYIDWRVVKIMLPPFLIWCGLWALAGFHVSFIANNPAIASDVTGYFLDAMTQVWEIGSWWVICGATEIALVIIFLGRDKSKLSVDHEVEPQP